MWPSSALAISSSSLPCCQVSQSVHSPPTLSCNVCFRFLIRQALAHQRVQLFVTWRVTRIEKSLSSRLRQNLSMFVPIIIYLIKFSFDLQPVAKTITFAGSGFSHYNIGWLLLLHTDETEVQGEISSTTIPFDYLIYAVGAETQTFGIPGVKEHACFMKEIQDAEKVCSPLTYEYIGEKSNFCFLVQASLYGL